MPTSHSGDQSTVSNFDTTAISIVEPVDGDLASAASVTSALNKIADYINYVQAAFHGDKTATKLKAVNIEITAALTIGTTLSVGDDVTITDHLSVGGDTVMTGQLAVNGIASFSTNVSVNGDEIVYGTLTNAMVPIARYRIYHDGTLTSHHGNPGITSITHTIGTGIYVLNLSGAINLTGAQVFASAEINTNGNCASAEITDDHTITLYTFQWAGGTFALGDAHHYNVLLFDGDVGGGGGGGG